jgi:UTP--glucose-1-phosphate uridylyltransferase
LGATITTAVFPVAGRGTRFLPATKAAAKEMLPIVDKPLIQHAVEEALEAGARTLIFVTGASKRSIEDHFDWDPELERALMESGKHELVTLLRGMLPSDASCVYVRQGEPLGLGHAVLCARPVVGDVPFFVHLPDDLIAGRPGCLKQMATHFATQPHSALAVETVPQDKTDSYGIVAVGDGAGPQQIQQIVEKPKPADAPSNLAVVGRYLLTPRIFEKLATTGRGAGGEIQLTDAIGDLLDDEPVYAFPFQGKRHDCGSKLGYLTANVEYGLNHPEVGEAFRAYLDGL